MDNQTSRPLSIVDHLLARAESGDVRALQLLAKLLVGTKKENANV